MESESIKIYEFKLRLNPDKGFRGKILKNTERKLKKTQHLFLLKFLKNLILFKINEI